MQVELSKEDMSNQRRDWQRGGIWHVFFNLLQVDFKQIEETY